MAVGSKSNPAVNQQALALNERQPIDTDLPLIFVPT